MIVRYMPRAEHGEATNSIADSFGSVSARQELLTNEFQLLQAHVVQAMSAGSGQPTSQSTQPQTYAMRRPVNPEMPELADGNDQWEATVQRGGSPLRSEILQAPGPSGAAPPEAVVESQRMYCRDPYVEPSHEPSRTRDAMAPPQCQVPQTWLTQGPTAPAQQAPPIIPVQQSPFNSSFNSPLPTQ